MLREQKIKLMKWSEKDLFDIVFNAHVRLELIADVISLRSSWQKWNVILGGKLSCKHYRKINAYACSSKYLVVLKCCRNETSWTELEQNLRPVWVHFASHVGLCKWKRKTKIYHLSTALLSTIYYSKV